MNGYKTLIWNLLKIFLVAPLLAAGYITADQATGAETAYNEIMGGLVVLLAIGDIILRKLTTGPMGKLFK